MWATINNAHHAALDHCTFSGGHQSHIKESQPNDTAPIVTDEALLHAMRCLYADALDLVAREVSCNETAAVEEMRRNAKIKLNQVITQSSDGCSSSSSSSSGNRSSGRSGGGSSGSYRRLDSFYSECKQLNFLAAKNLSIILYKEWEESTGGQKGGLDELYCVCMGAVEALMQCDKVGAQPSSSSSSSSILYDRWT